MDLSKTGERIKEMRKKKGLTQTELAARLLGIETDRGKSKISEYEHGKNITLKNIQELSKALECDPDYLLGCVDHPDITTSWIAEKIPLSGDALLKLQEYKSNTNKRESKPTDKYIYPDEFIPSLLSFILENEDFNQLISRICSQNQKVLEYTMKSDFEKRIITQAYKAAHDSIKSESMTDVSLLREQYQRAAQDIIANNRDTMTDQINAIVRDTVFKTMGEDAEEFLANQKEGFCEYIFTERIKAAFDLVRLETYEVIEMNNFLNQRDLFNIVKEYNEPITKYRKEA